MRTDRGSQRNRSLPGHVMVYYAIALALYADVSTREVLRCLLEGVRWLGAPEDVEEVGEPPGKSAISQARTRLGSPGGALSLGGRTGGHRRDARLVLPRVVSDEPGRHHARHQRHQGQHARLLPPGELARGERHGGVPAAAPRGAARDRHARHLWISGAQMGGYHTSEATLARDVLPVLTGEMLCLADRGFLGFDLWRAADTTGAALLWRASAHFTLPVLGEFPDGSCRSELRWNATCQSRDRTPIPVRVIEYALPGVPGSASRYRVVTNILESQRAPATELTALYHERWEMEGAFDEFKTHLKGARRVLRSKTPELVRQEVWGFLLAHFAIRALMHEAALGTALGALPRKRDPDTLSFTHALQVTRRTLPHVAAIPLSASLAHRLRTPGNSVRLAPRTGRLQPRKGSTKRRAAGDE